MHHNRHRALTAEAKEEGRRGRGYMEPRGSAASHRVRRVAVGQGLVIEILLY